MTAAAAVGARLLPCPHYSVFRYGLYFTSLLPERERDELIRHLVVWPVKGTLKILRASRLG